MYIAVAAVVIIIVVAGVAAYVFLYSPPSGGDGGDGGGGEDVYVPTNATSLSFTVVDTNEGTAGTYKYFGKQDSNANWLVRIEAEGYVYILDGAAHKSYGNATGTWQEEDFTTNWDYWYPFFEGFTDAMAHWESGDITSIAGITISNIQVQPTLEDSLFAPPA